MAVKRMYCMFIISFLCLHNLCWSSSLHLPLGWHWHCSAVCSECCRHQDLCLHSYCSPHLRRLGNYCHIIRSMIDLWSERLKKSQVRHWNGFLYFSSGNSFWWQPNSFPSASFTFMSFWSASVFPWVSFFREFWENHFSKNTRFHHNWVRCCSLC